MLLTEPGIGPHGPELGRAAYADDDDDGPRGLLRGFGLRIGGDDDDDDDGPTVRRQIRVPAPAPTPAPARVAAPLPQRAPDEVLVRGLSDDELAGLEQQGFSVIQRRDLTSGQPLFRLRKPDELDLPAARQLVRELDSPESTDFNHYYRSEQGEACQGADCPARQMIAWPAGGGGCGAMPLIGMVDTGLNADHAALSGANIKVHHIDPGENGAPSDLLHGTAVASLLVGDSDSRSPGLVPEARLIAVDAFHRDGSDQRADAFGLVEALDYLQAQDVRIVNLSLAGPQNTALRRQIRLMHEDGILIVAAAGNNGPSARPAYPAAYDRVVAVTAVDRRGEVYRRANRGKHIDLAAPGVEVWTAASISGARTKTGTSYAAPFVTAAAALILQAQPDLEIGELRKLLSENARDLGEAGRDDIFGQGLLTPPEVCGRSGDESLAPTLVRDGAGAP
ncbi:S8 family serine peptidase [Paracoccus caeni]|uniref:S8 family serine peptidase n=2 Tax=Paracoccus caeni TaxID=657651 RepID=A0A934SIB6_9RHOB|nr:S8 family serine peptidase [Paracoccus caeni]